MKKQLMQLMICLSLLHIQVFAQKKLPVAAVLNVQCYDVALSKDAAQSLVHLELEKTGLFEVMDKYEVQELLKSQPDYDSCFSKSCLVAAGSAVHADKIITGRLEHFGNKIVITLKSIDVATAGIESTVNEEFINLPQETEKMIHITVRKLFALKIDQKTANLLAYYEQPVQNPKTNVNLSGPRFGAYVTTGAAGEFMRASEEIGGFEMGKVGSTFGWQFEKQYLSSGDFRALVEGVALVSGLESGRFIPSFTILNGFRTGEQGWEVAFGPIIRIINMEDGHANSQGTPGITTGFVLAGGRTFKSGYLNFPVNVYTIPRKEGWVYGISLGFNIYKSSE